MAYGGKRNLVYYNQRRALMKIRESVVSLSFIFPHPPEDKQEKKKKKNDSDGKN